MPDTTSNLSATPIEAQPRLFVEPSPAPGTEVASKGKLPRKAKATQAESEPPNLGKAIRLPVPDFNDPNRKPTCLEIDFPIAEINALSHLEGNAGKPIYQMSKWWARRRSSVFRSMLIAAATEAPEDRTKATALVWDHYYANHQKAGSFKDLKVLEPFMGGGTTVVEGSRLGFAVTGIDLNPVAWFVTKNEVACSDPEQVKALFDHIQRVVKPQVQPFYATTCPRGHKGRWIDTRKIRQDDAGREIIPPEAVMSDGFDAIALSPDERQSYRWEGPEVIYTFWAKHGPCKGSQGKACGHRTPIYRSPVIAEKRITTDYLRMDCPHCGCAFDAELGETRIAPGSERVIAESESPFTETTQPFATLFSAWSQLNSTEKRDRIAALLLRVDDEPGMRCPSCSQWAGQTVKRTLEKHGRTKKAGDIKRSDYGIESKQIHMYLLIHPKWLEGSPGLRDGSELGGWAGSGARSMNEWYRARSAALQLVEIRGRVRLATEVSSDDDSDAGVAAAEPADTGDKYADRKNYGPPRVVTLADGTVFDTFKGTVPEKSAFRCAACGSPQDILGSVAPTGHTPPAAPSAVQCHCPDCEREGFNYGGRFFKAPDAGDCRVLAAAENEWESRAEADLKAYWPRAECWDAYMMQANGGVNTGWGYSHWWKMFNARELLVHATLLQEIDKAVSSWPLDVCEQALGAFQQFLRMLNMFSFWHQADDKLAPALSNANYHPKQQVVETNFAGALGYGRWPTCCGTVLEGMEWARAPWDLFALQAGGATKTNKVFPGDPVMPNCQTRSGSSTDIDQLGVPVGLDLCITDPPFGNNLFYGDCSDFFYVWMRLVLLKWYEGMPERRYFESERTPRATEAVENRVEHPDDREPWETEPLIPADHVETVRAQVADLALNAGDPNPLFRKEPAHDFYCKTLSACWSEANRVLKPGGLLAFTFHHSEDAPWVDVLESLFDAGWVLVATYPIRSDETKGAGQFGSKKIEYDIIHVCRKRLADPEPVSWAKMRRWVKDEGKRYKELLERTHGKELLPADLKIILIGKCLEFYSRHYGQVLTGDGDVLGVGEALLGVNQLLGDLVEEAAPGMRRPPEAEPLTRTVLSLFADRESLSWDELSKTLRGTAIPPDMLIAKGWVRKHGSRVHVIPVQERYLALRQPGRTRKNVLKTDLDQAHFLIGLAMDGVDVVKDLTDATWMPKRSVEAILDWFAATSSDTIVRDKAAVAGRLLAKWRSMPKTMEQAQLSLFTKLDEVV